MAGDYVADALKSAKKTLDSANKFTHSITGDENTVPKSGNEFSNAAYHVATKARKNSGIVGEAQSAGEGIKARMETEAAAKKSLQ